MRHNVTLTIHTRATGRGAPRLRGTAAVGSDGTTIAGGVEDRTGTFFVAR